MYGPTLAGGMSGYGVAYKASFAGKQQVLYSFGGYEATSDPGEALVALKGNLYGTTQSGGAHGGGTIFELTPSGKIRYLYSFGANVNIGGLNSNSPMIALKWFPLRHNKWWRQAQLRYGF